MYSNEITSKSKENNEEKITDKNTDKEKEKEKDDKEEDTFVSCERDEFTLRDLLEIFQGPVPFESMIMLASTNKYEDIKELCPELFRPGRMTPIYFGYIDKKTLQEISLYFFKQKLPFRIPQEITIPTSEIIELALKAQQMKANDFDYFSKQIKELLNL